MINTTINIEAEFLLKELMFNNNVTLKDIYNCKEQHGKEIKEMMNIFNHNNDRDQRLSLEVIYLLSKESGSDFMDYYGKEYSLSQMENIKKSFPKEDIELIITAFFYNSMFYSFSMSICEEIDAMYNDEKERIIQFSPNRILTPKPILVSKQAATPAGIREILKDTITWNNRQCDVFGFLFQNGEVTFELHIKDTKGLEGVTELKLSITILNEDISVREEPLKFWNDSWNPGETAVYSTGNIKIVDYDRIIINELKENNV